MGLMTIVGYALYLVCLVCSIIILIHAFKESVAQGLLCLCIPFYILFYAFAKFQHPQKTLIIALWLAGAVLGGGAYFMGMSAELASM